MEKIPLDELEVKLQLLGTLVNLNELTSKQICKSLRVNFNVQCDEYDLFLLRPPTDLTDVDEAIITYKDFL